MNSEAKPKSIAIEPARIEISLFLSPVCGSVDFLDLDSATAPADLWSAIGLAVFELPLVLLPLLSLSSRVKCSLLVVDLGTTNLEPGITSCDPSG